MPASSIGLPAQCAGVAVTRSEQVIGVDLFNCASTFQAFVGVDSAPAHPAPVQRNGSAGACRGGAELVREFFQSVAGHARVRASASGLGEKVEIGGPEVLGSALLYADRLCHLAAFHFDEGGAQAGGLTFDGSVAAAPGPHCGRAVFPRFALLLLPVAETAIASGGGVSRLRPQPGPPNACTSP